MRICKLLSVLMSFVLFAQLSAASVQNPSKSLLRIEHANQAQLDILVAARVDIDQVRGLGSASAWMPRGMAEVDLWLSQEERTKLERQGLRFVEIANDAHEMWQALQELPARDRAYHDNDQIESLLLSYESAYPGLCQVFSIGQSVQGRDLWVIKISDNVNIDEDEPEFKYVSTMHGDEPVGTEMILELVDDLLTGYGSDSRMTTLVNEVEMYFLPMMNPDGNALGQRYNANGYDLNRTFPDPYASPINTPSGRPVEVQLVMNWTQGRDFVMSANYHGGAMVVNYPRDNNPSGSSVYTASDDDDLFIEMSLDYSMDNLPMYNGSFSQGITNGAAWYAIDGGMQDWHYVYEGGMEVCVELYNTKWPNSTLLPGLWDDNRESMFSYMEWVLRGVRGIVTSSTTGLGLEGVSVRMTSSDFVTWSSPDVGNYHRVLLPGTYTLEFSKSGYVTQTISGVSIGSGDATRLDVALVPETPQPVLELASASVIDGGNNALDPGETATLRLQVSNTGTDVASNLVVSLATSNPFINVSGSAVSLGTVNPGQSVTADFVLTVDAAAPVGSTALFSAACVCDETSENFSISQSIGLVIEGFETGNFTAWEWQQAGNAPWTVQTGSVYEGNYAAKAGTITHNQSSGLSLSLDVSQAGSISFAYAVSSESNYDFLTFAIDGVTQGEWSGTVAWTEATFAVSAGSHTFSWIYDKDGSVSSGSDTAWIDSILMPPTSPPVYPDIAVSPLSLEFLVEPGSSSQQTLEIANLGDGLLEWSLSFQETTPAARSIAGSTISTSLVEYNAGESFTLPLSLTNTSTDNEWISAASMSLPSGVTVSSGTNFTGGTAGDLVYDGSTGNGITVSWTDPNGGYGQIYPDETANGSLSITVDAGFTGDLVIPWTISGDIWGADPHEVSGSLVLSAGGPVVPPFLGWNTGSGAVLPGNNSMITLTADAGDRVTGDYTGTLSIFSNDPNTGQIEIPVLMTIGTLALDPVTDLGIQFSEGSLLLEWTAIAGASSYRVEQLPAPGGAWETVTTTAVPSATISVVDEAVVLFRVIALN